ncbi:MFS transporter [Nocardia australiensis]|uniref:MFS transporter n=1 Tax=Nocardia australiensis TaxID=2887191 RepID=UPI001D1483DF|nr:MFS transporter [Nocardia australiensis]
MSEIIAPPVRIGRSAVAALGMLAVAAGTLESVVTPALPLLQRELAITPAEGALLSITLLITGAVVTPIAGKLGDRYGGKRVLVRLMAVVSVGGLLSALAPNMPMLLLGQVLQGAMVGALPLSFILVRRYLPPGESQVAIGVVSGLFIGGGMAGTLLAGPVAEGLSRHWMFALPTIAIIAATVTVNGLLPADPPAWSDGSIDWPGVVFLSGTLVSLMAGLSMAPNVGTQPLAVGAVAVVTAAFASGWIVVERRAAAPMVDLRMLATPEVWSSCVMTFVICIGSATSMYLVPQLFAESGDGYGFGASATDIGRFLLPGAIAAAVSGPVGGFAARRFGARAVAIAGIVVMAATLIGLACAHTAVWHLVVAKALIALASGTSITALLTSVVPAVDHSDTGIATSLVLVTRVVGSAVGVQVSGAILTAGTHPVSGVPAESAFVTGFVVAGVVAALSLLVVTAVRKGARA